MIDYGKVRSTVKPDEVEIDEYSVWVNSDIKEIDVQLEDEIHTEYEFNQIRYTKDEYIKMIDERNTTLESQLTDTQLALCEIYEGMV
jgi:flagellar motility protein MotE (MotC chaperone)